MIKSLTKFGLSEKEAKVYLANLELGDATASEISLKADLPRTLVYDILERLIDLGLASYSIQDKRKRFAASNPDELLRIVKEKETSVKEVLPQLKEISKLHGYKRPKVEIYEGKEGMKTMMDKILSANITEFHGYGSSRSSFEIIPAFMEEWHQRRIVKRIKMKVLYNDTPETRQKMKKKQSLKYSEARLMPIKLQAPNATVIFANKVVFQSWTEKPFAVIIEDELMAKNQKKYFDELWKHGKDI